MPVHEQKQTQYHRNRRREVLAVADVRIQQIQVIDKNGKVRALVIWQCGPDILYADSMDGLFDSQRRKKAPKWVLDQLLDLSEDRKFDYQGEPIGSLSEHVPSEGAQDLPDFVQG
jgi:hypothetical protein